MVEAGENLRLPLEPGEALRVSREGVGEDLQRNFAVSRERIRQIEAKALRKLRHPSRSRRLRAFMEGT